MALSTTFNRLKREIGIKKCVIVDGNVGAYLGTAVGARSSDSGAATL